MFMIAKWLSLHVNSEMQMTYDRTGNLSYDDCYNQTNKITPPNFDANNCINLYPPHLMQLCIGS